MTKERVSILTNDLGHCIICGSPRVEIHHIFGGANRQNSERYGLFVPLCHRHHTGEDGVHFDADLMRELHQRGQLAFECMSSHEEFMRIFGRNYL